MVGILTLHEADALPLDGVCDEGCGPSEVTRPPQPLEDLWETVTIDLPDLPSHRLPFIGEGFDLEDLVDWTIELELVVVDDSDEVLRAIMPSGHGCLPDLALLPLSISDRKSTRLNSSHVAISYAVFC